MYLALKSRHVLGWGRAKLLGWTGCSLAEVFGVFGQSVSEKALIATAQTSNRSVRLPLGDCLHLIIVAANRIPITSPLSEERIILGAA
jgi:hypothetical protein